MSSAATLSLCLGLLLGSAATWFTLRPVARDPAAASLAHLIPDPTAAAIAAWLDLRSDSTPPTTLARRAETLRALLVHLPEADFPRLLKPLSARDHPDDRHLLSVAFDTWADRYPAAATRWAGALTDAPGLDVVGLARYAALAWAKLEPLAAATWACALPDEARSLAFAKLLLPLLAEKDPAAALALAAARSETLLDQLLPTLIKTLAKTDPAGALQTYGARLWKKGKGWYDLLEPIRDWTRRDPAAAMSWVLTQPFNDRDDLHGVIMNLTYAPALFAKDPRPLLATTLANLADPLNRQSLSGTFFREWHIKDPSDARAWLDKLPDRHLRNVILECANRNYSPDEPEPYLKLALLMTEGGHRTERFATLLGAWANHDPSAALSWMDKHEDEPGVAAASAKVQGAILGNIARDEPATALAEWAKQPDAIKKAAIGPIVAAWGQTDPAAALAWFAEQPAASTAYYPTFAPLYAWAKKEPLAALRWAESRPTKNGRPLDSLKALSGTYSNEAAPRAPTADLYTQIQNPELRVQVLTDHLREWLGKDRPAAQAWLDTHNALTPAQSAALLVDPH